MRRVTSYYEYTTQDGDTFDLLALDMYNDERLAHYIIEYNPDYCDVIVFEGGVQHPVGFLLIFFVLMQHRISGFRKWYIE